MPRAANTTVVDDPQITVRLKHGIHTIFLFAMLDWTFSRLSAELLSILRDRYPEGLRTSQTDTTPVPTSDSDVKVVFGLPKNPSEPDQGWKNLKAKPDDTLGQKGLTDMCSVAFALLDSNADEDGVAFQVELPTLDNEEL